MEIKNFHFSKIPEIYFGEDEFLKLRNHYLYKKSEHILLVIGGNSFKKNPLYLKLLENAKNDNIRINEVSIKKEPSPAMVDNTINKYRGLGIDLVVAIGGGSVLDFGKAVSAMILQKDSVMSYIEGVGEGKKHNGKKIPLIAVPTTSGTGSEATKNAVLSNISKNGFKKSLRHDNFVPDVAILDPGLMISCPKEITASTGLDALTQLIGAYMSTKSSLLTDSLALSGIEQIKRCLIPVCTDMSEDKDMRSGMAYGALMSGIVLANAGLGIVHGFASSIGGYFDIPHGVICGTLLPESVRMNIRLLVEKDDKENRYLKKYAKIGSILTGSDENDIEKNCNHLIEILDEWVKKLEIPRLSSFGINEKDIAKIVEMTDYKNNPIDLTKEQMIMILKNRI